MRLRNVSRWVWGGLVSMCVGCSDADPANVPDTLAPDTSDVPDTLAPDISDVPDTLAPDISDVPDTLAPDTSDVLEPLETDSDTEHGDTEVDPGPTCPWEDIDLGLDGGRVDTVAFDPRAPDTAWSFSGGIAFRSTDRGATWTESATQVAAHLLAFPPSDAKEILVGSSGLSISRDSGRTFEPLALSGLSLSALSVDAALPQRVWVGVNGLGLLRSDDAGRTFFPRNNGITSARILSIASFPDRPDTNLVGTVSINDGGAAIGQGRIFRSTNAGATWTVVNNDAAWVTEIVTCPSRPGLAYAAARSGARRTDDYGVTWKKVFPLEGLDVLDLALSSDCAVLYAVATGRGIYRLTDEGATIEGPMVAGLDLEWSRFAGSLSAHPTEPRTVLLGSHSGLFSSADGGFSWRRVSGARGLVPSELVWSRTSGRLYLSTFGSGLWSRTSSSPWSRAPRPLMDFLYSVAVDTADPGKMVVGAQGQGWVSATGVAGLTPRISSANVFDAAFVGDEWLAATQTLGVRRSADGVTWVASNDGLAPWATNQGNHIDVRSFALAPGGWVYGGTRGRGVIVSEDVGKTWRFVDNTLSQSFAMKVLVDALDHDTVYALTEDRGVFVSVDHGLTWDVLGAGHESLSLTTLVQDPVSGALYVGQSRGPVEVLTRGGSTWTSFRRFCGDAESLSTMVIQDDTDGRWLVGARLGNRVMRTRLD